MLKLAFQCINLIIQNIVCILHIVTFFTSSTVKAPRLNSRNETMMINIVRYQTPVNTTLNSFLSRTCVPWCAFSAWSSSQEGGSRSGKLHCLQGDLEASPLFEAARPDQRLPAGLLSNRERGAARPASHRGCFPPWSPGTDTLFLSEAWQCWLRSQWLYNS